MQIISNTLFSSYKSAVNYSTLQLISCIQQLQVRVILISCKSLFMLLIKSLDHTIVKFKGSSISEIREKRNVFVTAVCLFTALVQVRSTPHTAFSVSSCVFIQNRCAPCHRASYSHPCQPRRTSVCGSGRALGDRRRASCPCPDCPPSWPSCRSPTGLTCSRHPAPPHVPCTSAIGGTPRRPRRGLLHSTHTSKYWFHCIVLYRNDKLWLKLQLVVQTTSERLICEVCSKLYFNSTASFQTSMSS